MDKRATTAPHEKAAVLQARWAVTLIKLDGVDDADDECFQQIMMKMNDNVDSTGMPDIQNGISVKPTGGIIIKLVKGDHQAVDRPNPLEE